MARLVFLDSGPLGMISHPRGGPDHARCRQWVWDLQAARVRVFVPEIVDYEVRRELIRAHKPAGLRRLDQVKGALEYAPITTAAMLRAAELWAQARRAGRQAASDEALDADCILAAQALQAAGLADVVTVATENVAHLGQFVDARPWDQVTP
jgi:predicted nucleic acid-binding protein